MTRRRRRRTRRLPELWETEGLPGDQPYAQQPLGVGLGPDAHAQLEALLATSSQPPQAQHLGAGANDFGGGAWGGNPALGDRSSAPQIGSGAMQGMISGGLSSGNLGSSSGLPRHSSTGGLFGSGTLGSGAGHGIAGSGAGISPTSVGPGGICMDFLAGRCPRGVACSLSHMLPSLPASAALSSGLGAMQQQPHSFLHPHQQQQAAVAPQQQQQQQQQRRQSPGLDPQSDGMMLLRGMEMTRATAEVTRQELNAVIMGQARLLQEQAAGLAALEKQVVDLQRYFSNALLTFEQRHWAALLGNEQRITSKVEQTISHIVTAMDNKFEELRALHAEDGLVRRALSSNASTAQWPQGVLTLPQQRPNSGALISDNTMPGGVVAAMGRLNMGSGEVRMPPVSGAGPAAPTGDRAGPSPEQEEVEALLREISASSAGGSSSGALSGGSRAAPADAGGREGSSSESAAGGAPHNNSGGSSRGAPPPQPRLPLSDGMPDSGDRVASMRGGRAGEDEAGGEGGGGPVDETPSAVGSTTGAAPGGRRSSSSRSVPDEVVKEVKELQDEETGQLLDVFKEHILQSGSSGASGGVGGGSASSGGRQGSQDVPATPSSDHSNGPAAANVSGAGGAQRAASQASSGSSAGSDARSGDVRAKLKAVQKQEAQPAAQQQQQQ